MAIMYCCPSLGCNCGWIGQRTELFDHFKANHVELLLEGTEFHLPLTDVDSDRDVENNYAINYLMCYEEDIYLVQVFDSDGKAQVRLRYSGSETAASGMRYSVQVRSGNLVQTSNQLSAFYSAVKGHPGLVEIDAKFLKSTWKVKNNLICKIQLEGIAIQSEPIEFKPRLSKSLEDCTDLGRFSENNNLTKDKNNSKGHLQRSTSDQTKSVNIYRSRKLTKAKAIHKSDQSLFYSDEFLDESDDAVESLMEHLTTRINQLKDYKCIKCDLYIAGPIYQCSSNHSMCHPCLEESEWCPCSMDICTDQRNPILEKMRDETVLPCRFEGCTATVKGAYLQQHHVQCNHCVYTCPYCTSFMGKYNELETHWRILHPSIKRLTSLKNPFPVGSEFVVIHAQGVFHCRSFMNGKSVDWTVKHCGHGRIYFECEVDIKSNKPGIPKNFKLCGGKNERNALKRSISINEIKLNKLRGAVLSIRVYEAQIISK